MKSYLRWFVAPLPPPGPIEFSCEWPAVRISLRHELDAARQIEDAAKESRHMLERRTE